MTKHQKVISGGLFGEQGLAGVFFTYELSPMMVKYTEKQRWLTALCDLLFYVFQPLATMHHRHGLSCSVSLVLFTLFLVHLILHVSPTSLSPSISLSAFHSRLKTHLFHKFFPSFVVFWFFLDCLHGSWTSTGLGGYWHLFVLVSFVIFLFSVTCARLSWSHSAFQCTLNYSVVLYQSDCRVAAVAGLLLIFWPAYVQLSVAFLQVNVNK